MNVMVSIRDKTNVKIYKVVIIGDSSSGKTSILLRFAENTFKSYHDSTIGVDLKARYITSGDTTIKLYIWDTAGQERFRSIIKTYYEQAAGIILVFDLNNRESFLNLTYWIRELSEVGKDKCPMILVGNKCDLKRKILDKEIHDFVINSKLNMIYMETSARDGINVDNIFMELTKKILDARDFMVDSKILSTKESEKMEDKLEKGQINENSNNDSCCVIS